MAQVIACPPAAVDTQRAQSSLAWWLWSVFMSLPWLVPTHAQPWTSFHAEAATAVGALPMAVWAVIAGPARFVVPLEALALIGIAAVAPVQRAFGLIDFAGDAWLAATYALTFAAATVVGARAQQLRPWTPPDALFASFAVAAIASVPLMLAQWLQWDGLGTLLLALPPGARPSANVGQPNQLATLLVWGLLALWWGYERARVRGIVVWPLAAFLLSGVAMTQSRAGWLEVVLLGGAATILKHQFRIRHHAFAVVALAVWFVAFSAAWPALSDALQPGQAGALDLQERMRAGTRLLHWRLLLDAAGLRPWFGWGWNQTAHAQAQLAPLYPASHEVPQYAHDIFLDLVLWNGVPLGALAGAGIVAWCIWQCKLARSPERTLPLLMVGAFLLHATVELPHGYLLFLLPVGLMIGALHQPTGRWRDPVVERSLVAIPLASLVVVGVLIIRDYGRIEDAWMAQRFRAAHIGSLTPKPIPPALVLSNLRAWLASMRIEPRAGMSAADLDLLRQVSHRYLSAGSLFSYAWALALNGDTDRARRNLVLLCKVSTRPQCAGARQAWLAKSGSVNVALGSVWPPGFGTDDRPAADR